MLSHSRKIEYFARNDLQFIVYRINIFRDIRVDYLTSTNFRSNINRIVTFHVILFFFFIIQLVVTVLQDIEIISLLNFDHFSYLSIWSYFSFFKMIRLFKDTLRYFELSEYMS